jgi:hypothetical protein
VGYLLITSSRAGTQPANLQGIWCPDLRTPWSSNWTANINVQMNYRHVETCNLTELHQPFFDLLAGVAKTGSRRAGELRREGVGLSPQYRPVAAIRAGGDGFRRSYLGELRDERSALRRSGG